MRVIFFVLCSSVALSLNAQKTVDVGSGNVNAMSMNFFNVVGGQPFVSVKFTKLVEGSPFFNPDWMKANVVVNEKNQYPGIYVKLDLYDNEVHYQDAKGNEMIAVSPIQKIVLFDSTTQQIHTFINCSAIASDKKLVGWYELLAEGKATLYKQIKKDLSQSRPYGSATYEQRITSSPHYFILRNSAFLEVKKIKDLPNLLVEKKEEVAQYIKTNNLPGKTDEDFVSAVNYFNSLN